MSVLKEVGRLCRLKLCLVELLDVEGNWCHSGSSSGSMWFLVLRTVARPQSAKGSRSGGPWDGAKGPRPWRSEDTSRMTVIFFGASEIQRFHLKDFRKIQAFGGRILETPEQFPAKHPSRASGIFFWSRKAVEKLHFGLIICWVSREGAKKNPSTAQCRKPSHHFLTADYNELLAAVFAGCGLAARCVFLGKRGQG